MTTEENKKESKIKNIITDIRPILESIFSRRSFPEVQIFKGSHSPESFVIRENGIIKLYPDLLPSEIFDKDAYFLTASVAHALILGHYINASNSYESLAGLVNAGLSDATAIYVWKLYKKKNLSLDELCDMLNFMTIHTCDLSGKEPIDALDKMLRNKRKITKSTDQFISKANEEIDKLMDDTNLKARYLDSATKGKDADYFMYNALCRYGSSLILPALKRYFVRKEIKLEPATFGLFVQNIAANPKSLFSLLKGHYFHLGMIVGMLDAVSESGSNENRKD